MIYLVVEFEEICMHMLSRKKRTNYVGQYAYGQNPDRIALPHMLIGRLCRKLYMLTGRLSREVYMLIEQFRYTDGVIDGVDG